MIKQIDLNIATYRGVSIAPKKVNYIFGANGTGKTSLARVISAHQNFPECKLTWDAETLPAYVYNKDFVKANFGQDSIKGIFTLGTGVPEAKSEIDGIRQKIKEQSDLKNNYKTSELERQTVLTTEENELIEYCWSTKLKYDKSFKSSMTGGLDSKKKFKEKCVFELLNNKAAHTKFDTLVSKYATLFAKEQSQIPNAPSIQLNGIDILETSPTLQNAILGQTESIFSKLISNLGNIDWVREGLDYHANVPNGECPFCQQLIKPDLLKEIQSIFDDAYKESLKSFKSQKQQYEQKTAEILKALNEALALIVPGFQYNDLAALIIKIESCAAGNKSKLEKKEKEQKESISLEPISNLITLAIAEVSGCQAAITEYNAMISNIKQGRIDLSSEVWKFIVEEMRTELESRVKRLDGVKRGIESIQAKISTCDTAILGFEQEIKTREAQISSVEHSVNEINRILRSFQFKGFALEKAIIPGHYKLIRPDGTEVKDSLSEGESTFISFLYFFQLLNGSTERSGIESPRIVVIDDPISSLDSNVLFIVSSLVKQVIRRCLKNEANFEQVFVSTHNIYFQKEISYKGSRDSISTNESFWIIRKINEQSEIAVYDRNQVSTSYELLWKEVRDPSRINAATIFNTIRRILEYYFKIIGSINYEEEVEKFEIEDKQVARALIGWINDGSHFVNDDLLIESEMETSSRYLEVFKMIFDRLGHISHYNMMMKGN